jgi:hypothetical protein
VSEVCFVSSCATVKHSRLRQICIREFTNIHHLVSAGIINKISNRGYGCALNLCFSLYLFLNLLSCVVFIVVWGAKVAIIGLLPGRGIRWAYRCLVEDKLCV